jgi:hypothetical protein
MTSDFLRWIIILAGNGIESKVVSARLNLDYVSTFDASYFQSTYFTYAEQQIYVGIFNS